MIEVSITSHLVVFTTFLEDSIPTYVFSDLLFLFYRYKDFKIIFETIMSNVRKWD
jgi:hypothetical protein